MSCHDNFGQFIFSWRMSFFNPQHHMLQTRLWIQAIAMPISFPWPPPCPHPCHLGSMPATSPGIPPPYPPFALVVPPPFHLSPLFWGHVYILGRNLLHMTLYFGNFLGFKQGWEGGNSGVMASPPSPLPPCPLYIDVTLSKLWECVKQPSRDPPTSSSNTQTVKWNRSIALLFNFGTLPPWPQSLGTWNWILRARDHGNLKPLIGENAETILLHFALQLEGLLGQGILNECEVTWNAMDSVSRSTTFCSRLSGGS